MEKYIPPICDCGTRLDIKKEIVYEEVVKINKNFKISKRFKIIGRSGGNGCDWLECPNCENEYILDMILDGTERIMRGDRRI